MPKSKQYFLLMQQLSARNGKYSHCKMHEMENIPIAKCTKWQFVEWCSNHCVLFVRLGDWAEIRKGWNDRTIKLQFN